MYLLMFVLQWLAPFVRIRVHLYIQCTTLILLLLVRVADAPPKGVFGN